MFGAIGLGMLFSRLEAAEQAHAQDAPVATRDALKITKLETFLVNAAIYEIPDKQFQETLGELTELLGLAPLLKKQVRKLSLGESGRVA